MEYSAFFAPILAATFAASTAFAAGTPPKKDAPAKEAAPAAAAPTAANDAAADKKGAAPKQPVDDDPLSDETITGPATATTKTGEAVQKTGPSVLVLPFQPIYRSVPQNKIQMANDLLAKELNQKDTLVVLRGGVSKGEAAAPSIDGAVKAAEEAQKAEAAHDGAKAIEHRKKVLEEMEKNAAAVEPDDFVRAHHYLARAYMWAGQDDKASEAIEVAARMRPAFPLEATEFSRLYRKWAQKAGEKAIAEKPTDLMVRSALPGASISLDGRPMDVAPVILKKIVPGKHLIGARIEGVPPYASVVDVKPGKQSEIVVSFANTMGGSAVGIVADAIAQNSIPRKAVESAAQAGKEAGAAYVVAGGLAKDEDRFHVHAFVVDVAKTQIKALDVVDFDLEMLTSESDVLRVVQNVSAAVAKFDGGENAVGVIEKRARSQNTVNEVNAAPSAQADDGAKASREPAKKKEREIFKPLKGTKVQIKDEEED